ncbi:helix-turn-helix domain-containing protein [Bdellovibrionota bacterium FG-1]
MSADAILSLGEFLRQEREKRGITIEQVASATKVGIKTLHALEGDHYADLPAKPFIRGFVKSYARFIGVDAEEVLTRFGDFLDLKAHDRPNRESGHSGYAFEKREGDQSRTLLWIVMGAFVVAGGVAAIFIKKPLGGRHHGSHAEKLRAAYGVAPSPGVSVSPTPTLSVAAIVTVPTPTPSVVLAVISSPSPNPSSTEVDNEAVNEAIEEASPDDPLNSGIKLKSSEIHQRVVFRALDSVWVRYQCDHRPVTQFIIRSGNALVLRAREGIRFQVSAPKSITFSYKGSSFKPMLGDQNLTTRQGDATLFFPFELADSIKEPFPTWRPIAGRVIPSPRPSPSPSVSLPPVSP